MKTTLENAIKAMQIVTRLNGIRMKNTGTARKLFSLKKLLEPNFEFYADEERKLIEELGGTVTDDGAILFGETYGHGPGADHRHQQQFGQNRHRSFYPF